MSPLNTTYVWSPPPMWKGEVVFIIGGGPSLKEMDLSPIYDRKCIGANYAFLLGNWIDIVLFGDHEFWNTHRKDLLSTYTGEIVTCCTKFYSPPLLYHDRVKALVRGAYGLEERRSHISWNNSTGGACISLAYKLGSRKIVLLGFDMKQLEDGSRNFHDKYTDIYSEERAFEVYAKFIRGLNYVKIDAEKKGVEILNATPDSALNLFPKVVLSDII